MFQEAQSSPRGSGLKESEGRELQDHVPPGLGVTLSEVNPPRTGLRTPSSPLAQGASRTQRGAVPRGWRC